MKGVRLKGLRIPSLLFKDDRALLVSSKSNLQLPLWRFVTECEMTGIRISASKSEEKWSRLQAD